MAEYGYDVQWIKHCTAAKVHGAQWFVAQSELSSAERFALTLINISLYFICLINKKGRLDVIIISA